MLPADRRPGRVWGCSWAVGTECRVSLSLQRPSLGSDSIVGSSFGPSLVVLGRFMFNSACRDCPSCYWVRFDCTEMFGFPVSSLKTVVTANPIY